MSASTSPEKKLLNRVANEIITIAQDQTAPEKTGQLKDDIQVFSRGDKLEVEIGNTSHAPYAASVHFGTGIYGKNKKPITPKRPYGLDGKPTALKTPYGYRKSVKGQKPNPYLDNAVIKYSESGGLNKAMKSYASAVGEELIKNIKAAFKRFS
jgi:hypothetical protein